MLERCKHGATICYLCGFYGTDDPAQIAMKKALVERTFKRSEARYGTPIINRVRVDTTKVVLPTIAPQLVWRKLHRYAWEVDKWNEEAAKAWYVDWKKLVPVYCLKCGSHWLKLEKLYQPDFTSREAFFRWTWDRHNDINSKLGKKKLSYDDAISLYSVANTDTVK